MLRCDFIYLYDCRLLLESRNKGSVPKKQLTVSVYQRAGFAYACLDKCPIRCNRLGW